MHTARRRLVLLAVAGLLAAGLLIPSGGGAQVPTPPLPFVAIDPCRVVDTRGNGFGGPFGPPSLAAGAPRDFPLVGQCGLPPEAQAVSLNVTATNTLGAGFFLLHPAGGATPLVSTLNYVGGETVANAALVPLGPGGLTVIAGVAGADLILDVNGYFVDAGVLAPTTFQGAWASGTGYGVNDLVSFGGLTYVSRVEGNTGNAPASSPGQWALFTGSFDAGGGTFQVTTGGVTQVVATPGGDLSLSGTLTLPAAASATAGTVFKGAARFLHNAGTDNTFLGASAGNFTGTGTSNTGVGVNALQVNTTGSNNTATGADALGRNTTGVNNTATGRDTLSFNTTGSNNTATGLNALSSNTGGGFNTATGVNALASTTGFSNTATGADALGRNTTGVNNTATGRDTLFFNTMGNNNTATGVDALGTNTTGTDNTATGVLALGANTTGGLNTAMGLRALQANTTGGLNTAMGLRALEANTGDSNTAMGAQALRFNTTGSGNTALGHLAGFNATTGSDNVYIANPGEVAVESATTRIGTAGTQTRAFIAGITGVNVGMQPAVLVTSAGQLGVNASSARVKEAIEPMGEASRGLLRLRPVTFRYRQAAADGTKPRQYGLIAEEAAEVYPDLVAYASDGQPETVLYHVLPALLLNELQRQQRELAAQAAALATKTEMLEAQGRALEELRRRLEALEGGGAAGR